jgi:D-glycero-D-manno-heptose 1,7-bisphosphate phosphatase
MSVRELEAMHLRMCDEFMANGARIDAVYYCPHDSDVHCVCRKPSAGMLLAAARTHTIDLNASWIIGDSDSDIQAGRNAGCRTARILRNNEAPTGGSDVVGACLFDAACALLRSADYRKMPNRTAISA